MAAPPLINSRALHSARLLVSPVPGDLEPSSSFAVVEPLFSFSVTVSAFLISFVPPLSLYYLLQPSQCQYSILPLEVFVAAFASICLRLPWFFASSSP